MGLQYVVAKRIFGFDKDKNVKYVAKSVGAGELDFDKLCAKVSRILGIHRKTVDLVAAGLVDIMSEASPRWWFPIRTIRMEVAMVEGITPILREAMTGTKVKILWDNSSARLKL